MKYIDLSLPNPEQNLSCDEALLEWCEASDGEEILRVWESRVYFIVLGYASKHEKDTKVGFCRKTGIPILRRMSGGGTVLQGPGCLNYGLILKTDSPKTSSVLAANEYVLEQNRKAVQMLTKDKVDVQPLTDLAIGNLKCSGNAQRRGKKYLLFHGTFLLDFDLGLIDLYLNHPEKEPSYRQRRPHREFLINLKLPAYQVKEALQKIWNAHEPFKTIPYEKIVELELGKYSSKDWNFKY